MGALKAGIAAAAVLLIAARPPATIAPAPATAAAASVKSGVERWRANDYAAAVAIWQPFAAAGDADALFNMGQAYKLGRGVAQDAVVARDYYRKAAAKGHLPAQANLGIALFQVGEKAESIKWLRTAADRGEPRAQYVLGIAAFNGDGLPRSQSLGYAYLLRAQASGLPQAATALGSIAPGLSPTDRTAGEAVAASLAAGTGVPAALAANLSPKSIPTPGALLKPAPLAPAPRAAPPPVQIALNGSAASPVALSAPAPAQPAGTAAAVAPRPSSSAPLPALTQTHPAPAASVAAPSAPQGIASSGAAITVRPSAAVPAAIATTDVPASKPVAPSSPPPAPVAVVASASEPAASPQPTPTAVPKVAVAKPAAAKSAVLKPFETIVSDTPVAKKPAGWRVQLGAFSQRKLADAAWAVAKAEAGGAKPIFAAEGTVVKLQMGPYASREAAKSACAKLSDAGRACFITNG